MTYYSDSEKKGRIVGDISAESSMALADFVQRAFSEGYSVDDVYTMVSHAGRIMAQYGARSDRG